MDRVAKNSFWTMGDRVARLAVGLVVWVWMARLYGPVGFGTWNFAIAFTGLFTAIASLGLDGIVVRELAFRAHDHDRIVGTAFGLKLMGSAVAAGLTIAIGFLCGYRSVTLWLITLNAIAFVAQATNVVDFSFQSRVDSKPVVIATNTVFLAFALVKLLLLSRGASLPTLGAATLVEAAITGVALLRLLRRHRGRARWSFDPGLARRLLSDGWPLVFSGLAIMLYMRVDQIMIGSISGVAEVGVFAAALRISEVWYFVPMSVAASAFPVMLQKRSTDLAQYARYTQRLYDITMWLGVVVALSTTLLAGPAVRLLYGPLYGRSADVLSIQTWAGVAVSMSFVHTRWLLAENFQRYSLLYTVLGCIVNLSLNVMLIPRHGAVGAAWATLVTQTSLIPVQLLFRDVRSNFFAMLRAVTAPVRIVFRA